jgi:hypothetical protein
MKIAFFDACRDNPLRMLDRVVRGLALADDSREVPAALQSINGSNVPARYRAYFLKYPLESSARLGRYCAMALPVHHPSPQPAVAQTANLPMKSRARQAVRASQLRSALRRSTQ